MQKVLVLEARFLTTMSQVLDHMDQLEVSIREGAAASAGRGDRFFEPLGAVSKRPNLYHLRGLTGCTSNVHSKKL